MMSASDSQATSSSQEEKRSRMSTCDLDEDEETYVPLKKKNKVQDDYQVIKKNGFFLNYECEPFIKLEPSEKHIILFDHTFYSNADHVGPPNPLPKSDYIDKWNDDYVRMPFSDSNKDSFGNSKWKEITKTLTVLAQTLVNDPDSLHIEYAIKRINPSYKNTWNFGNLHYLFNEELEGVKGETILRELVPRIIRLALSLPQKICSPIPILKQGESRAISLTQEQCSSILANCLFCTFPGRCSKENPDNMPFINFNGLFARSKSARGSNCNVEKIKCILHYFQRVTNKMPEGVVTFTRCHIPDEQIPNFRESNKLLRTPVIRLEGTIEDCTGAEQLDFANKFLGGGVLNHGCVQEEIRFMICPELVVSMLFTECLNSNECAVIRGCERFSSYTGYGSTFEWDEDYEDLTARDQYNRMYTDVLAIDALKYRYPKLQFGEAKINRELKKCYVGFHATTQASGDDKCPVLATGNWGCGAFGGDRQLKFLIQIMSASQAGRDLIYYTFDHQHTFNNLTSIVSMIDQFKLTVGEVYKLILEYSDEIRGLSAGQIKNFDLCQFLQTILSERLF